MFCRPQDFPERYPQAKLHDKWPGTGRIDDPAMLRFLAGTGPSLASMEQGHRDAQVAGADLLDQIGPAILMTHSAGGPAGWLIADARPDLVKAIISVEPAGPPFAANQGGKMTFGLSAAPLTFEPPLAEGEELKTELRPAPHPDLKDCLVQAEPARKLPNLARIPVVVVTAEASWMAADNHGTVDFLLQAGVDVRHLRLEDHGVHGNGHAMMLESNSDEVAAAIADWISAQALEIN
jgi:pimeloyl-ACP methyl ester carboxylesterase